MNLTILVFDIVLSLCVALVKKRLVISNYVCKLSAKEGKFTNFILITISVQALKSRISVHKYNICT